MNKELLVIIKEIKRVSETEHSCTGTHFIDFKCNYIECPNCILTSVNQPHRYSSQIVITLVKLNE